MKSIVLTDDHAQSISLLLDELQSYAYLFNDSKAVLHVGAHMGEEVPFYLKRGFKPIFLVEANPELCHALEHRFKDNPYIYVINNAICDKSGPVELIIHKTAKGSVESSSILPLKMLGEVVPVFDSSNKVLVEGMTLDNLIKNFNLVGKVDLLCLDIQGAELLALSKADVLLESVKAVICEVNVVENYSGGAIESEISDLLSAKGFDRIFTIYHELYNEHQRFPAWGEGLWVKL